ncbi:hypothetical protein FBY10_1011052 [Pseudomonas sp. SJZ103]|nr:hypothetical protein FBY10_1011052 [Pseudomonas sp. SJZ103]TWC92538.1 hypothetical protein FBY08_1017 [Pseudomonas sp. SJZ094]
MYCADRTASVHAIKYGGFRNPIEPKSVLTGCQPSESKELGFLDDLEPNVVHSDRIAIAHNVTHDDAVIVETSGATLSQYGLFAHSQHLAWVL